jgi:flagellar basal-body rod modification protein FlgD
MNVDSATTSSSPPPTPAPSGTHVDYQAFLKLLVAQMKNQDPTSPMDSTDYVAQLATFSQVEQSVQMSQKLDSILQASALTQATAMIGKEITSADGKITGIVKEVNLYSDGVIAVLETGEKVLVQPGIQVRDSVAAGGNGSETA